MSTKLVDIECKVVSRRERAIAIVDGTMETVDSGEREKWFWLPLSLVEVDEDAGTVTMPEWVAEREGLI